jgi:hypothetical protein
MFAQAAKGLVKEARTDRKSAHFTGPIDHTRDVLIATGREGAY